jgi:hypothetical protein
MMQLTPYHLSEDDAMTQRVAAGAQQRHGAFSGERRGSLQRQPI